MISDRLNDKVFLGTTCLTPFPELIKISEWTAANDQSTSGFMATGTILEIYNGNICSDGGATAGPKMTPLFQDGKRDQLIVDLMATGYPSDMVYNVNLEQYKDLIEFGMDEFARFVKDGTTMRDGAITLCAKGSDTSSNTCK